jgi:hypothetical protein
MHCLLLKQCIFGYLAALFVCPSLLRGQGAPRLADFNRHGWFFYSGDHPVSGRWGIHFDGQWRRSSLVTRWQQYQIRPGVNYWLNDSVMLTMGYVFTNTYPYGDVPARYTFPEHRSYQQVLVRQPIGRVLLSHRYRLEQRFIGEMNPAQPTEVEAWRHQNRFRYQLRAMIPITRGNGGGLEWYVPVSNEILIHFGPNFGASIFDQNRPYIGIGHSFGDKGQLEIGYLNQILAQRNGRIMEYNHTMIVSFTSTLPLRRPVAPLKTDRTPVRR